LDAAFLAVPLRAAAFLVAVFLAMAFLAADVLPTGFLSGDAPAPREDDRAEPALEADPEEDFTPAAALAAGDFAREGVRELPVLGVAGMRGVSEQRASTGCRGTVSAAPSPG
jgi:hypothetical protein